ncbi:MAG TPA: bifunctional UDP-sugar hydrolase/5'-nucleotidase [Terriglobales bacterium]|nr:bifunctional UDP-sugar hydrolase/5'-nucleotidase [Terriglobales bacterium]
MSRRNRKKIWLVLLVIAVFALFLLYQYQQSKRVEITILYWNDFHASVYPHPESEKEGAPLVSGSANFAGYVLSLEMEAMYGHVYPILVCAGDEFTGDPLSSLTQGKAQIEILNLLHPSVFELGNHEFDYGIDNLKKDLEVADFPVVCANLIDKEKGRPLVKPYIIIDDGKLRIAFIGLITESLQKILKEGGKLQVVDAESTLTYYMNVLSDSTDIQVLVSHMGVQADKSIAKKVQGLELIIGGHSHSTIFKPAKVGNTLICQAGSNGKYIGKLDLFLDSKGKVLGYQNKLVETFVDQVQPDTLVKNKIDELEKNLDINLDEKIGELETPWIRNDERESNVGNFLTDAMRNYAKADVAFTNSGGIRKNLKAGPITVRDIWEIAPFSDRLVLIDLTGGQLLNILEKNCRKDIDLLQVSGVKYSFTPERPYGERVIDVLVNNEKILPYKTYKAVINDYILAQSKDFLGIPKQDLKYKILTGLDRDVFIKEVKQRITINSQVEGRITELKKVEKEVGEKTDK